MEQLIESLVMAGVDREKIERARHRGLAYQCQRCLEKDGTATIKIRCRMEDHIMHGHLGRDEWPFYCELCNFKCRKYNELIDHLTTNKRHIMKANKEQIVDHRPFLRQNPSPHVFGPLDFKVLTPEGSLLHFLGLSGQDGTKEGDLEAGQPSAQPVVTKNQYAVYTSDDAHPKDDVQHASTQSAISANQPPSTDETLGSHCSSTCES